MKNRFNFTRFSVVRQGRKYYKIFTLLLCLTLIQFSSSCEHEVDFTVNLKFSEEKNLTSNNKLKFHRLGYDCRIDPLNPNYDLCCSYSANCTTNAVINMQLINNDTVYFYLSTSNGTGPNSIQNSIDISGYRFTLVSLAPMYIPPVTIDSLNNIHFDIDLYQATIHIESL